MYKNELDNLIRGNKIPRAMMLYGECYYYIDRYKDRLSHIEDAEVMSLYFDEYDFEVAKAHLSQGSLFGDKNMLIIKSEKKLPKSELDTLVALVQKNSDNYFIYCFYGENSSGINSSFDKKQDAGFVRFFNPKLDETKMILTQEAQRLSLDIDDQSKIELINIHQNDVALAVNELKKLAILNKQIGLKDIQEHTSSLSELRLDDLFSLVLEKKEFLKELRQIQDLGYDATEILTQFNNFFVELFLFNSSIKLTGDVKTADILGYNPPFDIVNKRKQQSMKIGSKNYKKAINHLLDMEQKIKSAGKFDAESLLYASLIKVQTII